MVVTLELAEVILQVNVTSQSARALWKLYNKERPSQNLSQSSKYIREYSFPFFISRIPYVKEALKDSTGGIQTLPPFLLADWRAFSLKNETKQPTGVTASNWKDPSPTDFVHSPVLVV